MTNAVSSIVCSRYANSLADLAEASKVSEHVSNDLTALQRMLVESTDLAALVQTPRVSRDSQAAVLRDISEKSGFSKLTVNFLQVLVQNRRINALENIISAFFKELSRRRGDVDVGVETAIEMSAKQTKDLEKKISDAMGRKVSVKAEVNPKILGGMILTIGSYMIDDSVRRKLDRLGAVLIGGSSQNNNPVQNLKEVI